MKDREKLIELISDFVFHVPHIDQSFSYFEYEVAHWMPMPEPPKEG